MKRAMLILAILTISLASQAIEINLNDQQYIDLLNNHPQLRHDIVNMSTRYATAVETIEVVELKEIMSTYTIAGNSGPTAAYSCSKKYKVTFKKPGILADKPTMITLIQPEIDPQMGIGQFSNKPGACDSFVAANPQLTDILVRESSNPQYVFGDEKLNYENASFLGNTSTAVEN